jgi:hypothetical protein
VATWQGALIRADDIDRLLELAARYRIVVSNPSGPWLLIDVEPQLGRLGPPSFSEKLSRDMQTSVIGFFLQTTVTNERVEHWENGTLVRELEYYLDGGGWIAQRGTPQPWEAAYFFSDDEGTRDDENWPRNLSDEISTDDIARYEDARSKQSAGPVMDLLSGGSISRLCAFYGVDPKRPAGYYRAPPNWRVHATVIAIISLLIGALILGAISR